MIREHSLTYLLTYLQSNRLGAGGALQVPDSEAAGLSKLAEDNEFDALLVYLLESGDTDTPVLESDPDQPDDDDISLPTRDGDAGRGRSSRQSGRQTGFLVMEDDEEATRSVASGEGSKVSEGGASQAEVRSVEGSTTAVERDDGRPSVAPSGGDLETAGRQSEVEPGAEKKASGAGDGQRASGMLDDQKRGSGMIGGAKGGLGMLDGQQSGSKLDSRKRASDVTEDQTGDQPRKSNVAERSSLIEQGDVIISPLSPII